MALQGLSQVAALAPGHTSRLIPTSIQAIAVHIWDTKPQITNATNTALLAVYCINDNPNVSLAIPAVLHTVSKTANTYSAVDELMAAPFITTAETSTLSILCLILSRVLKEHNTLWK